MFGMGHSFVSIVMALGRNPDSLGIASVHYIGHINMDIDCLVVDFNSFHLLVLVGM